jgi:hypothetical protein
MSIVLAFVGVIGDDFGKWSDEHSDSLVDDFDSSTPTL